MVGFFSLISSLRMFQNFSQDTRFQCRSLVVGGMLTIMLYFLGACLALYMAANFLFRKIHLFRCTNKLPRPSVFTLLRTLRDYKWEAPLLSNYMRLLCDVGRPYEAEGIFCVWGFFRPFIFMFKPEIVQVLLSSSVNINRMHEIAGLRETVGDSLLTSTGSRWRRRKRLLLPAFHHSIMEDSIPVFHEHSMVAVRKMIDQADRPFIDIGSIMSLCSLDMLCETMMGVRLGAQKGEYNHIFEIILNLQNQFMHRILKPWLWVKTTSYFSADERRFFKQLQIFQDMIENVISQKRKLMKEEIEDAEENESRSDVSAVKKRKPLLELLLDQEMKDDSFTEQDVQNEVKTFIVAGHDTTATAVSFCLHCLGSHQAVQEKVIDEMDSIFGDDIHRPVTMEDLQRMEYTECVIKESLRLYPTLPIQGREIDEDLKVGDYTIAAGSTCFVLPMLLHRNPESFPDPEKFDPDRFLPENSVGCHRYAFVPFSAGPRDCIGRKFALLEEKTILANIFRNMRLTSLDAMDKFPLLASVLLKNVKTLRLRVTPRFPKEKNYNGAQ